MDPISQGIVGATAVQQFPKWAGNKRQLALLTVLGFLSGMAPDLDILIRSSEDPMLFLEYHRQFTHSLIFIPIGGFICACLAYVAVSKRSDLRFTAVYAACTLGYATHGLLDACTSYGTLLLWPFSNARIAWHNLPIIEPLLTLPLIGFCVARLKTGKPYWSRLALLWFLAFPLIGLWQREQAAAVATELAASRGHVIQRQEVRPAFGNLFVWKSIYQTKVNGRPTYFVDAIHVSLTQKIYPGDSIAVLDLERDFPWLDPNSQQAKDVERFRWFSDNYLSVDPQNPLRIVDMRYSMMPHEIKPFWGVQLDSERGSSEHIAYTVTRQVEPDAMAILWAMMRARPVR